MEELEVEVIELREMDSSHEVIQVLAADTTKCELSEGEGQHVSPEEDVGLFDFGETISIMGS